LTQQWHAKYEKEGENNVEHFRKPVVICDYNKHVGGVDVSDQYISSYSFIRKSKKWWRKMFFWLLEVAVVNSFILYNLSAVANQKPKLSHKKYRLELMKALVGVVRNREGKKRGRPSTSDQEDQEITNHTSSKPMRRVIAKTVLSAVIGR